MPLLRRVGVFPIQINAIEPQVLDQCHTGIREPLAALVRRSGSIEMLLSLRIGPAPDREHDLEVAMVLLKQVKLLETAVHVVPCIIPRVAFLRPVDV